MRQFTDQEIDEIYTNIKNGIHYCGIRNGFGEGVIYKSGEHGEFIAFRYFGESAVKSNKRNLCWLLQNIFERCETISQAVWSDYHINYVPIKGGYKGIDFSRSHPNVFGL